METTEKIVEAYVRYVKGWATIPVLSTFLCKFFMSQFFEEWQIVTHFSYRV